MFEYSKAVTSFAVDDVDRAAEFYREQLGIECEVEAGAALLLHPTGGNDTLVYSKQDHVPGTFTILNFVVSDIDEAVDSLALAGVRFLRYDDYGTDEKGVVRGDDREMAWFTDPSGNIHSVVRFKTASPF